MHVDFQKEKDRITLRATNRGNEIEATISGEGLRWSSPLPSTKQVISYEAWLRNHQHPASLELLDKYIAAMKEAGEE
jgi:hypothetical protein